jgi:hypothetical protein
MWGTYIHYTAIVVIGSSGRRAVLGPEYYLYSLLLVYLW